MLLTVGRRVGKEYAVSEYRRFRCALENPPRAGQIRGETAIAGWHPSQLKEWVHNQIAKMALTPLKPYSGPRAAKVVVAAKNTHIQG